MFEYQVSPKVSKRDWKFIVKLSKENKTTVTDVTRKLITYAVVKNKKRPTRSLFAQP